MKLHSQHCVYHKQCMIIYKCSFKHIRVSVLVFIECYICTVRGNEFQVLNWLHTIPLSMSMANVQFHTHFLSSNRVDCWSCGKDWYSSDTIPMAKDGIFAILVWTKWQPAILWWVCWVSDFHTVDEGMPPGGDFQSSLRRSCFILVQHVSTFHDYNY